MLAHTVFIAAVTVRNTSQANGQFWTLHLQAAEESGIKKQQAEKANLSLFRIFTRVFCDCCDNLLCSKLHY